MKKWRFEFACCEIDFGGGDEVDDISSLWFGRFGYRHS